MTVLEDLDLADGIYQGVPEWEGMIRQPAGPLVASAIPVRPPTAWFANPGFPKLEPLTIQSDGRVSGHIASWREDHIGMNGRVKAPRSKSGYAFFATGVLETNEGKMVNVGQITLTGGHAPLEASVAEAVAHYDNTDSAICDVSVGEDRHGIWVAGALRPTVTENQLRSIRASSVSGDWRPINGSLEMVAVCAVNVPGFPIPRARVASGVPIALVAAGTGELVDLMVHQDNGATAVAATAFDDRLRFIEDILLGKIGDKRAMLAAAVDQARAALGVPTQPDPAVVAAGLRERVHPTPAPSTVVAALYDRVYGDAQIVWADGMPYDLDLRECVQASLRSRVKGGMQATATKEWTSKKRETASKRGQAMPGGRYPIADCTDVTKAIRAMGRGSGSHASIKRHIIKRAKSLGCMEKIPDDWK